MGFYDAIRVGASGAAGDFTVDRSLRFNDGDSPYLSRTPSSAGNRKTFTFSAWVKRCSDARGFLLGTGTGLGTQENGIEFDGTILRAYSYSGSTEFEVKSTARYRDFGAWMHVVFALDTTQASSGNRAKLYVNGEQITDLSANSQPSQNYDTPYFNTTTEHRIGQLLGSHKFDGYIAEINFIDGLQLTPASFGATDVITGQWNPKKYTGSYGTNGFYLNFSDNSGTTATTLGKDSSGNGNNFTPNNFSVSAGTGNDSLEDTPTNNFATLNALKKPTNGTLSNGNLDGSGNASDWVSFFSTILVSSGKWFCEVKVNATRVGVGIGKDGANENSYLGSAADTYAYFDENGKWNNGSSSAYGATYTTNDIIGMALDMDAGTLIFYKNGASQGTAFTGLSGEFALGFTVYGGSASASINYGQRAFDYTVPTGYKALNSANLPDPTIKLPNKHFDTLLYSGTGSSNSITGLNFAPDWVWAKRRNASGNHHLLIDQIRGGNASLMSNNTDAENTNANRSMTFNSNGVTWNSDTGNANASGGTYVLWNWDAGETDGKTYTVTVVSDSGNKYRFDGFGTSAVTLDLAEGGTYIFNYPSAHPLKFSTTSDGTHGGGSEYTTGVTHNSSTQVTIVVAASAPTLYYYCSIHSGMGGQVNTNSTLGSSNFAGSIQSTAKVNASAGFSIIAFEGTGSLGTVGHGLGVKPDVMIFKNRDEAHGWNTYHSSLGATKNLELQKTDAVETASNKFNDTEPTSTVMTVNTAADTNQSNKSMICYCFSGVAGYSKFGSYTGNGNADGTFVFTGFRPAWVMIKRTDASNDWFIQDDKRLGYNPANSYLEANTSLAEQAETDIDILSNGFKCRSTGNGHNASGGTFIYLAFAESPFKNARAR